MVSTAAGLSHQDFLRVDKDYEAAASLANLIYVTDKNHGINRQKKGKGFTYEFKGETVTDEKDLERIKMLVIPPAWTNVWICKSPSGHIQATGYDVAGRKQYKYHPRWNKLQQETKFHRLYEFGCALPFLRKKLRRDLNQPGFPESKVLAMVLSLMERTYIRVGNNGYEKLYGSYGLTTLKNKHVDVKGDTITFAFKGKKGVYHKISLKSKKFARIIKQCKAIPGSELFQYYDDGGNLRKVDSGQVNQYIKDALEQDFTTKDFRTWAGTMMMFRLLKIAPVAESLTAYKKNVTEALLEVSKKLGNTVAVCRKYYVHPELVNLYQQEQLTRYFEEKSTRKESKVGLTCEEQTVMKILKLIRREKMKPKATSKLLRDSIRKQTKITRKRRLSKKDSK
jgi:DNA topoisomerase-1